MTRLLVVCTALLAATAYGQPMPVPEASGDIPARPESLVYDEFRFDLPDGSEYRRTIAGGIPVYVAEDHTFPLVSIRITLRQGSYLEPADKVGLAGLTGALIRSGGTESMTPEAFDEEAEFLAANISSFGGDTQAGASVACITPELDASLALFFDMLRHPRFDQGRLDVEKGNLKEAMNQRNDDADDILGREWGWLMYGKDHYTSRRTTLDDVNNITREDLAEFHEKYWRPENMTFAISGDVNTEEILEKIEGYLADWPGQGADVQWPPPQPTHQPTPGVYHVEKDIPQGKTLIGHLTPQWTDWDNPDRAAIQIMERILGSGGFTSRLMKRVRSDEGLAYSARASFGFDPIEPGTTTVSFQSKSPTVALAASIALEEIRRMQDELVTQEELDVAKASLIETFPRRFESVG